MNLCIPNQYDHSKLMSKQELLDHLKETGAYGWVLGEVKERYEKELDREMEWHFPLPDGYSTGCFIVPVREGFLFLPYDEVDRENYEILDLDEAKMMRPEACEALAKNARTVADALCDYLQGIQAALPYHQAGCSERSCGEVRDLCKSRGYCEVCGEHFCKTQLKTTHGDNAHLRLLRDHGYSVCTDCLDKVLDDLAPLPGQAIIYIEDGIVQWMSVPEGSISGYIVADLDSWKEGDPDEQISYLQRVILANQPDMKFVQ